MILSVADSRPRNQESQRVRELLPQAISENATALIGFLEQYYEYMNTVGLPSNVISNITTEHDIDRVSASYLDAIQAEIANSIPNSRVLDRVSLYKKIVKYYSIRGTSDSALVFFRIFFDELIELVYPKDYLFKTSDGSGKVIPAQFEIDRILSDIPISSEPEYITINPVLTDYILTSTEVLTANPQILTVGESSLTLNGINSFTFDTLYRITDLNGRARYVSSENPSHVLYWDSPNIRWTLTTGTNSWVSYSDVINPQDAIDWNALVIPASTASLTINADGDNNTILYTANFSGTFGNDISITYATPAEQATTDVAVFTSSFGEELVQVTPGTKARMVVTGELTSNGITPLVIPALLYTGVINSKPSYTETGDPATGRYTLAWNGAGYNYWALVDNDSGAQWESSDSVATPDLVTTWTPIGTATGTPIVVAEVSSAAQFINAVNNSVSASALVTASAIGTVTGSITNTIGPLNLSGALNISLHAGTFTTTYYVNNIGATVPQSLGELVLVSGTDDVYECTDFIHYTWELSTKNAFDTWKYSDRKGFISDRNRIQDGYRWQEYSYGIRTGLQLEDWEKSYLKLVHPAGLYLFSELLVLVFRSNIWDNYINYDSTNPTVDLSWLNAFISPRLLDPTSNAFHSPKFQPGWLSSNNRKLRFIIAALIAEGAEANFIRAVYIISQSIIVASNSSSEESQREYLEYLKFWDPTPLIDGYANTVIQDAMENAITHVGSIRGSWYPWSNSTFEYDQPTTYVSPGGSIQYPQTGWQLATTNYDDIPDEFPWDSANAYNSSL